MSGNGGTAERIITLDAGQRAHGPQLLPDGRTVLFTLGQGASWDEAQIVVQSLDDVGKSKPLVKTEFDESNAEISPDGRWLAYQSNRSGTFEVYVQPFPDVANGLWPVSTNGGTEPVWARDGQELFIEHLTGL